MMSHCQRGPRWVPWHLQRAGDPGGPDLVNWLCDSWETAFPSLSDPSPSAPLYLLDLLLCHFPAQAGLGLARAPGSWGRPSAGTARAADSRQCPHGASSGLGLPTLPRTLGPPVRGFPDVTRKGGPGGCGKLGLEINE